MIADYIILKCSQHKKKNLLRTGNEQLQEQKQNREIETTSTKQL